MSDSSAYIETDSYCISQHKKYIKICWKQKVTSEEIKEGLYHLLGMLQSSGVKRICSDVRLCESSWTSSNEWIIQTWLPQTLSTGLQRAAFLISNNLVQKISVDNLYSKLKRRQSFISRFFKIFTQESEAQAWLEA
ncbi:MAG: hypothetical protein OHK0045_18790 [Raineya sp.]